MCYCSLESFWQSVVARIWLLVVGRFTWYIPVADYVLPAALKYSKNCGGICSFCVSLSMSLSPEYFLIYKKLPKKDINQFFCLFSVVQVVHLFLSGAGGEKLRESWRGMMTLGSDRVTLIVWSHDAYRVVHTCLKKRSVELLNHYETLDFTWIDFKLDIEESKDIKSKLSQSLRFND